MDIAVIGTGSVGSVLGRRWAPAGHRVVFGTRRPADEDVRELLVAAGPTARAEPPSLAANASEVVVLAVPGSAVEEVVTELGHLDGRIVAREIGFEPVDCGPLTSARYLEPLAMLRITLAHHRGRGPDFGFRLSRRG